MIFDIYTIYKEIKNNFHFFCSLYTIYVFLC
nr:MAG TPA: hypothetical protein [Caudoviricetes sp.]